LLPDDSGSLIPAAVRTLSDHLDGYASLLVGPGLGQASETAHFVHLLLGISDAAGAWQIGFRPRAHAESKPPALPPLVIDADALNALARVEEWWRHHAPNNILTPHPGEMGRLMGGVEAKTVKADRVCLAADKAAEWEQVIVLKGAYTVVAAPNGPATVCPFSTPALATAGTGDVLAGAIAGLLAQGLVPYEAALCGVYLHGLAGKLVEAQVGNAGAVASDLLPMLPRAIQSLHPDRG
jgi:NAD(P)H-hydrate epimerase